MVRAWNAGDGDAYAALFTKDCDYIAFDGTHLKGRQANASHHQDLFATVLKGSRMVFEGDPNVRFLAADVALMHAMGSVLMPWQSEVTAKRRSNQTYVVVRVGGRWLVTAFHNTRYRPMRLPSGPALKMIMFFMRLRAGSASAEK